MEYTSVGRRTRLQEKIYFEKYCEEKCGKKLRKRKEPMDSSRDSCKARRKEKDSMSDKDLKRKSVSKGSDEPEEVIIWKEDKPGRGSLCSTDRKGLQEKSNSGDNNGNNVIWTEEVVSNHSSSRVASSLGSGMNSGCFKGERSCLEYPEVVSSCLRSEGECILLSEDSSESGGSEDEDNKSSESNDDPDDENFNLLLEEDAPIISVEEEEEEKENNNDNDDDVGVDGRIYVSRYGESNALGELKVDYQFLDDDVGVDGKICVSRNRESNDSEEHNVDYQFLDDAKDGESNGASKEGYHTKKKQKQVIEDGLIRQKVFGMDILSTCNKKGNNMDESIAKRLQSRLLSESKRRILKLGTISHPLVVEDKSESSSDSEDKRTPVVNYKIDSSSDSEEIFDSSTDLEDNSESSSEEDTNVVCKNKEKIDRMDMQTRKERIVNKEKIDRMDMQTRKERTVTRKRKSKKKYTSYRLDLAKVISDKIWQDSSFIQEKIHCKLPLKFTFEDENPVVQEKEEWEKENEALFDEMELALTAIEIGPLGPCEDGMISSETEHERSVVDLCCKGKHDFKLEEETGMICRNCSYVLEMKYIFPDFAKDHFRRCQKKSLAAAVEIDCSFVNGFNFPNDSSKGNSPANVKGTVWDLIPGMKEKMYPHQHEGFEFIWEHLAGGISLEKLGLSNSLANGRNGCIINHEPGTGKTCLVIMFLLSFMQLYPQYRPVIVAPYSMLRNWEAEFQKWNVNIPFYNLNNKLSSKEYEKGTRLVGHVGLDNNCSRLLKLYFWRQEQSVLAISYQLFVKLAGEHGKSEIGKKSCLIRKILLELSDILVLDEGHTARNENTLIWKALAEMKTKRRIILSGTLFQNNFTELYNTLCIANPNFADQMNFANHLNRSRGYRRRHKQACDMAEEEWLSLTNSIVWKGDVADKLKKKNCPFVHVYKGGILLELPGKKDSRIDLRPTRLQAKLLNVVKKAPNYLRRKSLMSCVSIHPSLVSDYPNLSEDNRRQLENLASNPDVGVKTKFVFQLIRLCEALHERVMIFCSYVKPLNLIMSQLKSQFNWVEGREVLQMDGTVDQERRKTIISLMNDPDSNVRVLLASTKASNEGINLVGASRVVILDVGFNPSVETQAISRAYRIGQKKVVYVYHLITSGTLEVHNYHSQNLKEHISKLVFSSRNNSGASNVKTVDPPAVVLQDDVLESMVHNDNLKNMFEQIYERPRTD